MGLSRSVSEVNSDLSQKSETFPTAGYFTLTLKGFTLELCNGARGEKKLE